MVLIINKHLLSVGLLEVEVFSIYDFDVVLEVLPLEEAGSITIVTAIFVRLSLTHLRRKMDAVELLKILLKEQAIILSGEPIGGAREILAATKV